MAHKHPFRFGVSLTDIKSSDALIATARKMEDLGYSTLSTSDHVNFELPPLVSLIAVANATTTLRVGTLVLGNDFRHPAVVARELAALDVFSNGRLEFGLGTGWSKVDYDQFGIPLDPPGVRVSRFEEAVQIFKQFFSEQPFNFAGTYYTATNLNGLPKPIQSPHPPLLVGGGSKRMLSIAGREADIVGINLRTTADGQIDWASASVEATDQKIEWVRQAAGARFDALEFHTLMTVVLITDDPHHALAEQYAKWGIDLQEFSQIISVKAQLASPHILVGTEDEIVELLQVRRERFGISYYTLFGEDSIDLFAPIVARLAGT